MKYQTTMEAFSTEGNARAVATFDSAGRAYIEILGALIDTLQAMHRDELDDPSVDDKLVITVEAVDDAPSSKA